MTPNARLVLWSLVAAATLFACQGPVSSLSVQAGASIAIPVGTLQAVEQGLIGYGGVFGEDPQRGQMVFRLDSPDGFPLVTRLTVSTQAAASSSLARIGLNLGAFFSVAPMQVVSLVDVPADAPTGTHGLYVARERLVGGQIQSEPLPYAGAIRILPNEISVDLSGGGTELIVGEPTPLAASLLGLGSNFVSVAPLGPSFGPSIIPKPELILSLDRKVHSAELVLTYPASTIDVLDAYEPVSVGDRANHRALVWFDDAEGTLRISAANGGAPFDRIAVAFDLDDPAVAILDPATVSVVVQSAADADGVPLADVITTRSIR